jgi:hypothetical protein
MKTQIHINSKMVFSSNRISQKNLDKKIVEIQEKYNINKMVDVVKNKFKVFTSK